MYHCFKQRRSSQSSKAGRSETVLPEHIIAPSQLGRSQTVDMLILGASQTTMAIPALDLFSIPRLEQGLPPEKTSQPLCPKDSHPRKVFVWADRWTCVLPVSLIQLITGCDDTAKAARSYADDAK